MTPYIAGLECIFRDLIRYKAANMNVPTTSLDLFLLQMLRFLLILEKFKFLFGNYAIF